MLGVTTPAIGPTVAAVVARLELDARAALEERDRVLGVLDEALERGAAHQRAAQRAGRAGPLDGGTGVQELAALEAEQLARGRHVDQLCGDAEHRREGALVGVVAQRVGRDGGEVGLGAGHRGAPVDARDVDGLAGDGVGEEVGAGGHDLGGSRHRGSSLVWARISIARRVAPALDRWTSAPASTSALT